MISHKAKAAIGALIVAAGTAAAVAPAEAQYYRRHYHRDNGAAVGAGIALGIIGLGAAAIAADQRRQAYEERYYAPRYGYGYGGAYYAPRARYYEEPAYERAAAGALSPRPGDGRALSAHVPPVLLIGLPDRRGGPLPGAVGVSAGQ